MHELPVYYARTSASAWISANAEGESSMARVRPVIGDHVTRGRREVGFSVQVRVPVFLENWKRALPASIVQTVLDRVRNVSI